MIEKITQDRISLTLPTVFGEELTFLEFCGKMRAKLNECIGGVNKNTTDIQQNTTDIQQNASAISRNESDIVKLNGVINSVSAQADENTVNINTVSGKVDKNTADIQQNATAISKNTTDIQKNTSDIQQNKSDISANESSIATLNTAFNLLRSDFLNKKIESLFAPVILNVENHEAGADINASVYIRLGRIDWQGLGCLYAKINLSFSGDAGLKTLKIVSVQFGKRSIFSLNDTTSTFTANTDVISIPISVVGTGEVSVGTSDISVTGVNFFGSSEGITDTPSAFMLNEIPTGKDILCESLTFAHTYEQDSKIVYTLKASEGSFDIFATAAGTDSISAHPYIYTDFADIISNSNIFAQFLSNRGFYSGDTIASIPDSGVTLGAALINYIEAGTISDAIYTARTTLITENYGDSSNILKKEGKASMLIPFGKAAHISLSFDLFR